MKVFLISFLVCLSVATAREAYAQNSEAVPSQPSASREAYLESLGFRRIDTEVIYFDPSAPLPPLETNQEPQQASDSDRSWEGRLDWNTRAIIILISGLFLTAILYLFVKHGGRFSVSLRPQVDNPARVRAAAAGDQTPQRQLPGNLRQILGMQDRGAALILLAQTALMKTAEFNGLLLQQSWTLRDALRRLPAQQTNLPALRDLVLESERIQFGGRTIAEDEFKGHVDRIKPLLNEVWT